ncbi:Two-component system response regulator QseB [hydrothermal vent metagenome]|uniref:Two-component system response regulator QseB n=1 Tax=hydrothermal vent metagenome TaxID=652676 RepID=A0A3B0WEQ1_9ZZZZ
MRILLVEDDALLGDGIYAGLCRENNAVDWVKNGESALSATIETPYDCIILDIGLPKMSGLDVLHSMRKNNNTTPVLILTAQDDISDRVNGLDAGADDYLTKPFEFTELCARLRALTRRARGAASEIIRYKDIKINATAHTVKYKNQEIVLSRREFTLLLELITNQGRVLSKQNLEQKIYSWGDEIESNTIEVHIHHLRKKLYTDLIKTVRGIGYILA